MEEKEENGVLVLLDDEGIPTDLVQPVRPSCSSFPDTKKRKRGLNPLMATVFTRIQTPWCDLPSDMKTFFAPLLKHNKNGGYLCVNPQPGTGRGFQAQFWTGHQHVRLGTVHCARVGSVMVAAATLDASLVSHPLACREWMLRMLDDVTFRESWLTNHR